MLQLDPLVHFNDAVVDGWRKTRLLEAGVRLPAADLVEHQLDEQGQVALRDGLVHHHPLLVCDLSVGVFQPALDDCAAEVLPQWEDGHKVLLCLDQGFQCLQDVVVVGQRGYDDSDVVGEDDWEPRECVCAVRARQLVE